MQSLFTTLNILNEAALLSTIIGSKVETINVTTSKPSQRWWGKGLHVLSGDIQGRYAKQGGFRPDTTAGT